MITLSFPTSYYFSLLCPSLFDFNIEMPQDPSWFLFVLSVLSSYMISSRVMTLNAIFMPKSLKFTSSTPNPLTDFTHIFFFFFFIMIFFFHYSWYTGFCQFSTVQHGNTQLHIHVYILFSHIIMLHHK